MQTMSQWNCQVSKEKYIYIELSFQLRLRAQFYYYIKP